MQVPSVGPVPCDILVVGEAPGKDEITSPFMGTSGKELRRMLQEAGFEAGLLPTGGIINSKISVRLTNVFNTQPPGNKVEAFCGNRGSVPKDYPYPPLSTGNYVLPQHLHVLEDLADEIALVRPRVVLALGNTAAWALLGRTGIGKLRGNVFPIELGSWPCSVIPTYRPEDVLKNWSNRPIALHDIMKAKRFLDEGFAPKARELWLNPTLDECRAFLDQWIFDSPPPVLSFDIETACETITCIGFAPSPERAITIPFYDPDKLDRNYWSTAAEELEAWRLVHRVLDSPCPKLGQNGLYDIQYLDAAGIRVRNYLHDTMIKHHSLHPEMEKGLGFMGTMYTDEAPWKLLRDRNRDNFKIDDE